MPVSEKAAEVLRTLLDKMSVEHEVVASEEQPPHFETVLASGQK